MLLGGAWYPPVHHQNRPEIFCKLDPAAAPVLDAPVTPPTPRSPQDISKTLEVITDGAVSFADCQELARTVRECSKSLIEGTWVEEGRDLGRGRRVRFNPSSFESAKAYLRASVSELSSLQASSLQETPLSRPRSELRMVTCHGCHGPIGQEQHQGSVLGKTNCTLPHSMYCRGGVIDDVSWRACPSGYQYNSNIDLASNGPGFESTMSSFDFQPQRDWSDGPAFSTPAIAGEEHTLDEHLQQAQQPPPFPQSNRRPSSGERVPGMVQFSPGEEPQL